MSEVPLDEVPSEVTAAAHDAARGQVVHLTEHGRRLAAIVPAEIAAEMESMSPEAFRELLEDFADAEAARQALAEGGEPVPWEQVKAEALAQARREAEAASARLKLPGVRLKPSQRLEAESISAMAYEIIVQPRARKAFLVLVSEPGRSSAGRW